MKERKGHGATYAKLRVKRGARPQTPEGKIRELRRHLRELTMVVTRAISALDAEMQQPPSAARGQRLSMICNGLNLGNDIAKRFGLKSVQRRRS